MTLAFGLDWLIIYLLLGAVVGFMAGLLGIGGGGIMVPVLTIIFIQQGVDPVLVVHLALGTSMASIIVTALASLRAHHKKNAVIWPIVKRMSPAIIVSAFITTALVAEIKSIYLALFFAVFMFCVALQLIFSKQPNGSRQLLPTAGLLAGGGVIGSVSALVSIGGGALTVPFLHWQNIDIKKAIGTSAAIGLPIAVAGSLGYLINGWTVTANQSWLFGFIYLPAALSISASSFFTAPLGAKLAHQLPVKTLKKIFAVLPITLSLKMLHSIL